MRHDKKPLICVPTYGEEVENLARVLARDFEVDGRPSGETNRSLQRLRGNVRSQTREALASHQ